MSRWNESKNNELRARHGVGFDNLLAEGRLLAIEINKNYPGQVRLVFKYDSYCWVVIYEPTRERYVTLYPSRKATKRYLK